MQRSRLLRRTIPTALFVAVFSIGAFSLAGVAEAAGEPVVTTGDTQGVTDTFAQMGFYINDSGTSDITEYGVHYATDAYYVAHGNTYSQTNSAHSAVVATTGGYFYVYSLTCGTTYHFSAFATNGSGTGTGADATFATSACAPASPNITLNSPSGGSTITSWAPSVTWENAATCSYSYDNTTFTGADCGGDGSDIPAPAAGTVNLYLRAISSDDIEGDLWATFTYDPPPVAGLNSQPSQASPSDTSISVDTYVNDAASNPVHYTVQYSLNGGSTWNDAGHLSGTGLSISGNTISDIATHGDGVENRSQVAFTWDYTADQSTASTTNAEIRITPHDANGDGVPIDSDPFTLRAPPTPPVFADDSGAISDITENSVIVHYDMSNVGSAPLHHFELDYADDAYYTANNSYTQNTPITYTGNFADSGATNVSDLSCATTYHFVQAFTNEDGETATSSDATFTTSDCTGGGGGGGGGYAFANGSGTALDPYIIHSCEDLAGVNDYLDSDFLLDTDLDCSEMGNDVMIGSFLSDPFNGTFDGDTHTITVDIDDLAELGVGLFRMVYGGSIQDLTVDGTVTGEDVTGSVAGIAVDSVFENVHASSTVSSLVADSPEYPFTGTGGIVGGLFGGLIDNATFTGFVGSPIAAGGIAGFVLNDLSTGPGAIISRSSSNVYMYAGNGAGGIAGYLASGSQIRNSFASSSVAFYPDFATVYGSGALGGLVGFMDSSVVSRSYSTGSVSAGGDTEAAPSGGLIGVIQDAGTVVVHSFSASVVTTDGAPVGGFIGVLSDGDGSEQFYDDYFDTARSGQASCSMDSDFEQCTGADGSASGYWLDPHRSPVWAWDTAATWDISGDESEFPLLRHSSSEPPDESDAFTGSPPPSSDEGDDTSPAPPAPRHYIHSGSSVAGLFGANAGASHTASLASQIASLQDLLAKLRASAANVPVGPYTRDLTAGAKGTDVSGLQAFLIAHGYAIPAGATGYFGPQTRTALAAYQKAHGIVPAAGYFGPITRATMRT